jgi:hypothetical protein
MLQLLTEVLTTRLRPVETLAGVFRAQNGTSVFLTARY